MVIEWAPLSCSEITNKRTAFTVAPLNFDRFCFCFCFVDDLYQVKGVPSCYGFAEKFPSVIAEFYQVLSCNFY